MQSHFEKEGQFWRKLDYLIDYLLKENNDISIYNFDIKLHVMRKYFSAEELVYKELIYC